MTSSKTILIVEDERDVIDLLTLNLRKAGGKIDIDPGYSL
jgi:DNA-binding response OmpR family regulator